jgi:RNA polymerase sigma factor (sigma-70 family)
MPTVDELARTRTHLPPWRPPESMGAVREHEPSDAVLLERIAASDGAAFEELYHRYARAMFGLALRRLGNRSGSEDATQDAFAAIWRSAATFDPARGTGAAWLFTLTRNVIVDRTRRQPEPTVPELPDLPSSGPGPAEQAEADWISWRVHRALAGLPEGERLVLELAYFSELSQSEIAAFLDLPLGTVKTRTRAGLARLADSLGDDVR